MKKNTRHRAFLTCQSSQFLLIRPIFCPLLLRFRTFCTDPHHGLRRRYGDHHVVEFFLSKTSKQSNQRLFRSVLIRRWRLGPATISGYQLWRGDCLGFRRENHRSGAVTIPKIGWPGRQDSFGSDQAELWPRCYGKRLRDDAEPFRRLRKRYVPRIYNGRGLRRSRVFSAGLHVLDQVLFMGFNGKIVGWLCDWYGGQKISIGMTLLCFGGCFEQVNVWPIDARSTSSVAILYYLAHKYTDTWKWASTLEKCCA